MNAPPGPLGPPGDKGDVGMTGEFGKQGDVGDPGPQGKDGFPVRLSYLHVFYSFLFPHFVSFFGRGPMGWLVCPGQKVKKEKSQWPKRKVIYLSFLLFVHISIGFAESQ